MTRYVTLDYFLTQDQIMDCIRLKTPEAICQDVIEPNIEQIKSKLRQLICDEDNQKLICEFIVNTLKLEGEI
jgi:hypothetical protein